MKNVIEACAASNQQFNNLVIAGGVAANRYLYNNISDFMKENYDITTTAPPVKLCTDNAAMVAWAGIERFKRGMVDELTVKPRARWSLEEIKK